MQIELRSRFRRFSFAAGCFIVLGLYLQFALRAYLAAHLAAYPDLANLQRAVRLEPSNADYRELLGRDLALSGARPDDPISNYRAAVHLNPYEARYWLELAGAYQVAGRIGEQAQSVEQAVQADKSVLEPRFAAGESLPLIDGGLRRDAGACNVRHRQLTPPAAGLPRLQCHGEHRDLHASGIELEAEEVVAQHGVLRIDR